MGADPDPGAEPVVRAGDAGVPLAGGSGAAGSGAGGSGAGGSGAAGSGAADGALRGHAFISYVHEDSEKVDILHGMLEAAGVPVWRDRGSLGPGDDWQEKIREAINGDALVFIACFSSHSAARSKSFQYEELYLAIGEYRQRPPDAGWLLPVRLDDCKVPDISLVPGKTLKSLDCIDLFGKDAGKGRDRVVSKARRRLGADPSGPHQTRRKLTRRQLLAAVGGGTGLIAVSVGAVLADQVLAGPGAGSGKASSGRTTYPSPDTNTTIPGSDASTTTTPSRTAAPSGRPLTGNGGSVQSVAFSYDGTTLAGGSGDWHTRLWNVADPAHPAPLGQPLTGHDNIVYSVAFSRRGHILASGGADGSVSLWNVADPAHPAPLSVGGQAIGALGAVYSVAFSPDGRTLAVGSGTNYPQEPSPGYLWLWNVSDPAHPALLSQPSGPMGAIYSVAFSPDGHILASGGADDTIRLWNVADPAHPAALGQPLAGYTGYVYYSVAFSPKEHILASGSADRTIQLWNVADPAVPVPLGQPLAGHSNYVYSVAFSPDGYTLASGSADDTIRLWNVTDPASVAPGQVLTGHKNHVLSVAFSPDGRTLASGSADETIRLWRIS